AAARWVTTPAAYRAPGCAANVVDGGTTTNFDVISAKGEFLGGVYAPGIESSVEALAARAAQLRTVELVKPPRVVGKNTVECLQSGVVYGFAGQVDAIVRAIVGEIGEVIAVVATGGLAPVVLSECATVTHHEPMLTLLGLEEVFARNLPAPGARRSVAVRAGGPRTADDREEQAGAAADRGRPRGRSGRSGGSGRGGAGRDRADAGTPGQARAPARRGHAAVPGRVPAHRHPGRDPGPLRGPATRHRHRRAGRGRRPGDLHPEHRQAL